MTKFADSVKQAANLTSTATIPLTGASPSGYRTLAQAIADTAGKLEQVAVGDPICMRVDDVTDPSKFEIATYTIGGTAQAPILTRVTILTSSAGGINAVTFGGPVTVLCTVSSPYLTGLSLKDLSAATSLSGPTIFECSNDGGVTSLATTLTMIAAAVAQINGGSSDTTAPSVPGSLSTSSVTQSTATLSWAASTDNSGVAPTYQVSKDGTSWTNVSALSYAFTGLSAATQYTLRVLAVDGSGNKSASASLAVTTSAASGDTQAPTMSGSVTSSNITASGLTMSYPAGTDNVGIDHYEVSVDTGTANWVTNGTSLSYNATGLAASTAYTLRVRAKDAAGNVSNVLTTTATTSAQAAPIYTVSGYQGNVIYSTIDASGQPVYGSLRLVDHNAQSSNGYFYLHDANGNSPASAEFGWGTSPTVPPAEITNQQNANQGSSINGLAPMQTNAAFYNNTYAVLPAGAGTVTLYPWFKGAGDIAQCTNTAGVTFTGA